ncbi:MAG: nuclear transport factor 2 family protein [Trueperaceae bacterium]
MNRPIDVPIVVLSLLAWLALSVATAQDAGPGDLMALPALWEARYNEGDLDGLAALYTEAATLMPPDAPEAHGRDAVRAHTQGYLDAGAARAEISSLMDYGVLGDEAWGAGTYRFFSDAGDPVAVGKFLIVYRRVGDAWSIARHIWNRDVAPSAPPSAN